MKRTIFGLLLVYVFSLYCCNEKREIVAADQVKFATSSGISTIQVDAQITENLTVLGKVWGFLKYYHPAIAKGKYNWDFELFKILPKIIACKNGNERNTVLRSWINSFGKVEKSLAEKIDSSNVKLFPDINWITEVSLLGDSLSRKLAEIKNARRTGENHYVALNPGVGNPNFKNEVAYAELKFPDTGYRLLCLFRYWNIIQYYFPNRHLIKENWNEVLTEFIPKFINDTDALQYQLTTLSLIARIHDTHANIYGSNRILSHYKGDNRPLVKISFVQNNPVIIGFINDEFGDKGGLKIGDVILTINKKYVSDIVEEVLPYTPASNYPTQLRNIAADLLRTNDTFLDISFLRNDSTLTTRLKCYSGKFVANYLSWQKKDTCFKYLTPEISYIYPGTIKNKYFPQVMSGFLKTKGMIIDMRCYPSEFIVFTMGKYLFSTPTAFVRFSNGNIQTPGLFMYTKKLFVGNDNPICYKGKVVIIVNEQTQSQAEYTSMAFRSSPNATVIGSTTAGADGNVSELFLPGGIKTMISGIGVNYPDGRETQRVGIIPDIEVHPTIKGIREGRDELLEKAIEIINGK